MIPTVTLLFEDGTEAVWFLTDEKHADLVAQALQTHLGEPDSIKC